MKKNMKNHCDSRIYFIIKKLQAVSGKVRPKLELISTSQNNVPYFIYKECICWTVKQKFNDTSAVPK